MVLFPSSMFLEKSMADIGLKNAHLRELIRRQLFVCPVPESSIQPTGNRHSKPLFRSFDQVAGKGLAGPIPKDHLGRFPLQFPTNR